jgi:hypothetical protein
MPRPPCRSPFILIISPLELFQGLTPHPIASSRFGRTFLNFASFSITAEGSRFIPSTVYRRQTEAFRFFAQTILFHKRSLRPIKYGGKVSKYFAVPQNPASFDLTSRITRVSYLLSRHRLRIVPAINDDLFFDSPSSSPKEKVEVDLEQASAVLVEGNHEDPSMPLRSGRLSKGFLSWRRISTETARGKPPTKNVSAVELVTPPPPAKAKDDTAPRPHIVFENAPPPPLWTNDAADPELALTYKYPRFFLRDPTEVIDDGLRPFHLLSQKMITTLKHAHDARPTPTNAWSEPSASTINVRGANYSKDGIKVASETSMFLVLGVDSFVKCKHEDFDVSLGAKSFLQRWNVVCAEVGWIHPPFLLTINFIVPWGNFQSHFVRPDADEGPFCTRHFLRPSELSWKAFMEGSTVSALFDSSFACCELRLLTLLSQRLFVEHFPATGVSQQSFQAHTTCFQWTVDDKETRRVDSYSHRHQGPRVLPRFYC